MGKVGDPIFLDRPLLRTIHFLTFWTVSFPSFSPEDCSISVVWTVSFHPRPSTFTLTLFNEIQAKGENKGGKFVYSNSLEKVAKSSVLLHCLSICCWTNFSWIGTFRAVFIFGTRALRTPDSRSPGVRALDELPMTHGFKKMKLKKSFYRCLQ